MRRFEYTSDLVFADKLSGASPHQFIPETFKICGSEEGYYPNGDNLTNLQLLVKDVHYSIAYNSDFTEYTLTIFPRKLRWHIDWSIAQLRRWIIPK